MSLEKIHEILEKVQFQTMKSDDVLGDVKEFNKFFRKGKVGSWEDQSTVAQIEAFDELRKEKLSGSGLSFDQLYMCFLGSFDRMPCSDVLW